jgi:Delta3-Delta2-enoyl-CoA isomerase
MPEPGQLITHDAVVEVHLARPPANALDPGTVRWLAAILHAPPAGARALVLSGLPKMFCAGLDVPRLQALSRAELAQFWVEFFGLLRAFATCRVPVACAITGHAPAGGTVLAAFCDYRVMPKGRTSSASTRCASACRCPTRSTSPSPACAASAWRGASAWKGGS